MKTTLNFFSLPLLLLTFVYTSSSTTGARLAATQSIGGSVRSGAALAHALWLAQGDPSSVSVTMEGQPITIANGYPNAASIANTLAENRANCGVSAVRT